MKAAGGMKSMAWSVAKYLFAFGMLVLIIEKADGDKIFGYLRRIPPFQLLLAFLIIMAAQYSAALRMRYLFLRSGFSMSKRYATILFFVGAFYNILLPGGIGGDAYKVVLAKRRMDVTTKEGIRIMLADRASGLCIIMMTFYASLLMMDFSSITPYADPIICAAAAVTLGCYLLACKWLLKKSPSIMLGSLPYSAAGQALWVSGVITIWAALGNGTGAIGYVVLYCAASIAALLPVSPGGLGIKEMTYYYGAHWVTQYANMPLDGDLGIAISLCIFVLIFVTSLPGLLWLNKVEKTDFA